MMLPKEYLSCMRDILGDEFDEFLNYYDKPAFKAIRINNLKCNEENLKQFLPFKLKKSPFAPNSFYILGDYKGLGNHPLHHAGAFYVQEPSASCAVTALDPKPGDKVLDLCAAPGGKSTQIAALLEGRGLIWSNEVVKSRAQILLSNIERMGIRNAVVSSCQTELICTKLCGFFDKVLVDAPCSGEGMFRRDIKAIDEWSKEGVEACAVRQLYILNTAAKALKFGGNLVYSTCTFSLEENEGVVQKFLEQNPEFSICNIEGNFGRSAIDITKNGELKKAKRVLPIDGGEGHFVAKFIKNGQKENNNFIFNQKLKDNEYTQLAKQLFNALFKIEPYGLMANFNDTIIMLPNDLPDISGLGVIRAGIMVGKVKKSRIEPAHSLFMAAKPEELKQVLNFDSDSYEIKKFLKGEEIDVDDKFKSFIGVSVNSIMVGFGKCSNGHLKNKYPKGLRNI